ncbi:hypothetical protein PLESTB_001334900 [Pleodorina starrii]|uniref:Uncharacterized protein n=1 Tax=Pleodorina starrii TaxID=330485 RepID=A0A9W6BVF7_9CHLO|nr:hypothetical protein PLESTB_001334900 [Pleodorina starrii]
MAGYVCMYGKEERIIIIIMIRPAGSRGVGYGSRGGGVTGFPGPSPPHHRRKKGRKEGGANTEINPQHLSYTPDAIYPGGSSVTQLVAYHQVHAHTRTQASQPAAQQQVRVAWACVRGRTHVNSAGKRNEGSEECAIPAGSRRALESEDRPAAAAAAAAAGRRRPAA